MNGSRTMHGARRPDPLSKLERAIGRAADALFEGVEALTAEVDRLWKSVAARFHRNHR